MSLTVAQLALAIWGYPADAPLTLLSDANNTVYRVDAPTGAAVIRVHRPYHKSRRWIDTELRLLNHLYAAGLNVPHPLADTIEVESHDATLCLCTLLSWVDGNAKPVPDWYALIANHAGLLLGKIHRAAQTFELTPNLDRPQLDAETMFTQSTQYALDSEGEVLLAPYADIFSQVQAQTAATFNGLEQIGLSAQVIHGDYKPNNLLWARLAPAAVDFDDCAWGNPAYDMATLWLFLRQHPRYAQLKTYAARAWCVTFGIDASPALMSYIEVLVSARIALSCRWVAGNRHHPTFMGRAAEVIRERMEALAN
jgi:Ser/Thr protein kinase RdoA (MazF antagonist)